MCFVVVTFGHGIANAPRYVKKLAFECQVLAERRTYGRSQCPFSCRERQGDAPIVYSRQDYPGAVEAPLRLAPLDPRHRDHRAGGER